MLTLSILEPDPSLGVLVGLNKSREKRESLGILICNISMREVVCTVVHVYVCGVSGWWGGEEVWGSINIALLFCDQ